MPELKVEGKTEEEIYQMTDRPAQNVLLRELAQQEVADEDKTEDKTDKKEDEKDEKSQEDVKEDNKDTDDKDKEADESDDSDKETQDDSEGEVDDKEDEQDDSDEETQKAQEAEKQAEVEREKKEERITDFMAKHSTPRDIAERMVESTYKIKTKYDEDPYKIAQSNYFLQREVSKIQQKIQEEERSRSNPFKWTDEKVIFHGVKENGDRYTEERSFDQIVDAQRRKEPDATKDLEDKAVFALAKLDNDKWFEYESKTRLNNVVNAASTKTETFLKNLPERDRKYHDEIKEALTHLNPVDISTDDDSMKAVVNLIKGSYLDKIIDNYEEKIKKIEKEAFLKGKKNAKIIGEESEKADTQSKTKVKSGADSYSDEHKKKAEQMFFSHRGVPKEEKWKLYQELLDETK